MPPLTRWFVKSAFVHFGLALLVSLVLAARAVFDLPPLVSALTPIYFHLFMVGWVTQLIFGIAHWMFPVLSKAAPRGNDRLGWVTYGLINVGLSLRLVAEPWNGAAPSLLAGWLLVVSAVLQWLAGVGYVINIWGRVKER